MPNFASDFEQSHPLLCYLCDVRARLLPVFFPTSSSLTNLQSRYSLIARLSVRSAVSITRNHSGSLGINWLLFAGFAKVRCLSCRAARVEACGCRDEQLLNPVSSLEHFLTTLRNDRRISYRRRLECRGQLEMFAMPCGSVPIHIPDDRLAHEYLTVKSVRPVAYSSHASIQILQAGSLLKNTPNLLRQSFELIMTSPLYLSHEPKIMHF
ncbi:hypothetical protein IWQ51_004144 [Labrenzia sp. EL_142]|nr:hypothetical protein [Labrenzia sp. EL_142]